MSSSAASLVCALAITGSGVAVYKMATVNDAVSHHQSQSTAEHAAVAHVRTDFSDYVSATRGWALVAATAPARADVLTTLYASASDDARRFRRDLDATATLLQSKPDALLQLQALDTQMYAYVGYGVQAHADLTSGDAAEAARQVSESDLTWCSRCATYTQTLNDLASVDATITAGEAAELSRLQSEQAHYESVALLAVAATLALLIGAAIAFRLSVLRPIAQLHQHFALLSGDDGDLRRRTEIARRRGELGALASAHNTFLDGVQAVVTEVSAGSLRLGAAAGQLAELSEQATARNGQVAAEVAALGGIAGQVASQIQQVSASSDEIKVSAEYVAHAAYEAAIIGTEVRDLVASIDNGVHDLTGADGEIAAVIESLRRVSIMTRSLALTAVAGGMDAGPAEVTGGLSHDEVSELAARSAEAMMRTIGRIGMIQQTLVTTVQEIEHIRSVTGAMSEHALIVAGAVSEQTNATEQLTAIAEAATRGSQRIRSATERVAGAADVATATALETERFTVQLSGLAAELSDLVQRFQH